MNCISTRIAQVALFLATASLAFNASAAPAVKIDGVRQNFPWSNAVEINYSVTDCETGSANDYALRFVVAKGGETTDITAAVGAPLVTNTAAGKVVWDAPADFASTPADVTLSVSVVDTPFDGDLSKLVGDYEARDGQTLFGALAGNYKITIADGATVTLSNAVVTSLADDARFAGLTCLGDATIVLAGSDTNIVNGADNSPGIFVPTNHTLTIQGDGALAATGGMNAAGIGGGSGHISDCGNITISGGTVFATGGEKAAGIGSGFNGSNCGNITISGGMVEATGGECGAGIGSGYRGSSCGDISISGGTVIATGGYEGAGIGSGFSNSTCDDISISGGTVVATGGESAAGIGSGFGSSTCGNISISGGTVEATGGENAAGIGSGQSHSTCGDISIGAGIVKVVATRGSSNAESIGSGFGTFSSCGTVTIDPETVERTDGDTRTIWAKTVDLSTLAGGYEAQNGQTLTGTLAGGQKITIAAGATVTLSNAVVASLANGAGFAGLTCLGDATIVLAGSDTNIVNGAEYNPGIFVPSGSTLTIQGDGSLAATGGQWGPGIGSGVGIVNAMSSRCGNIAISGGTVVANGGYGAAGIGSGYFSSDCSDIAISGGSVVANGGYGAAGIGSGYSSRCGNITISGGTVITTGGQSGAGIGTGYAGSTCGDIAIGAGIVKVVATRGSNAECIGSGYFSTFDGTVTIDPETVERTDGDTRTILPKTVDLSTLAGGYEALNGQTLTGTLAGSHQLTIADGATVTLSNAVVSTGLTCLGDATLVLAGSDTNIVNGARYNPGIFVPSGSTLTIQGDGALAATGGGDFAAGIGSGGGSSGSRICGDITISGGTIVATGGNEAAGIGSGDNSTCGNISIEGGMVEANGIGGGAGIGSGGDGSSCGNISILGGTVVANGSGGAAGIGSGFYNSTCGNIMISGGTVEAKSGYDGAGIGSGSIGSSCGDITIGAGIVKVVATRGGNQSEIIGSGDRASCGTVTIDPGLDNVTSGNTRTIQPKRIDLSTLTSAYEVKDGWTAFGTLAGSHKITIAAGATVTLSNAVVASLANDAGFAGLTCLGDATIILAGSDTNIVNGTEEHPGIFVPAGRTLTIQGDGTLAATGGNAGAGIGSGYASSTCGNITISGGTVVATGGENAAGIGCGFSTSFCGKISIKGGTIIATGGYQAAGIGSGCGYGGSSECGDITISGGTVEANGGQYAAGIGSGYDNSNCGNIMIGAGIVKVAATRGDSRAESIGKGIAASCGTVTVDPGLDNVTSGNTRTIQPKRLDLSTVTGAYEVKDGWTIFGTLAGSHKITIAAGATVTLSNAVVTSLADNAGFAGLTCLGDATIVLAGSDTNIVNGTYDNPGIFVPAGRTLTIQGAGALAATGGSYGAGIGSGCDGSRCGDIKISGGTVIATGGISGAGIGSGYDNSNCGNITISGGTIEANGGEAAAGIGSGFESSCGDITISGGSVVATGGEKAAGIGSGFDGSGCGNITISGGTVAATGGEKAAGIGSGYSDSDCGDIAISGGTVEATGGNQAAGIGSGLSNSTCGNITIGAGIVKVVATRGGSDAESIGKGFAASCGTVTVDPGLDNVTSGNTRTIQPKRIDLSTLTGDYEVQDGWTLTGTLAGSHKITIAAGATVTLSNAVVTNLADNARFAGLTCLGDATIVLAGTDTNIVNGARHNPGIFVPAGSTLTIQGDGTLAATGGYGGAGIGGGADGSYCGDITISGGTVIATGGFEGAGIGSCFEGTCDAIDIVGGTVIATGGQWAAGIGSGCQGTCDAIDIVGGTVEATGSQNAAGIGSGQNGSCGDITIGAGIVKVVATSGGNGAESIGKGVFGSCYMVTITADPSKVTRK